MEYQEIKTAIAKRWYEAAKSMVEGNGLPIAEDQQVIRTGCPKGMKLDKATAMVVAGFAIIGEFWPHLLQSWKMPNDLFRCYDELEREAQAKAPKQLKLWD